MNSGNQGTSAGRDHDQTVHEVDLTNSDDMGERNPSIRGLGVDIELVEMEWRAKTTLTVMASAIAALTATLLALGSVIVAAAGGFQWLYERPSFLLLLIPFALALGFASGSFLAVRRRKEVQEDLREISESFGVSRPHTYKRRLRRSAARRGRREGE